MPFHKPPVYKKPSKGKPKKAPKSQRVPRTRNGGTQTEAEHMGKIRSALRHLSRFWKPIQLVRNSVKVGTGKNAKYYCHSCQKLHDSVEIDHIEGAGSLRSYDDLPGFCRRLFEENLGAYQALCKECHIKKTHGNYE